jgi:hypothetical protein
LLPSASNRGRHFAAVPLEKEWAQLHAVLGEAATPATAGSLDG